jgi:hypothetical protein
MRNENKNNLTIRILVGIIALLIIVLLFLFVIRPGLVNYNQNRQIEGYNVGYYQAISNMLALIQSEGYIQIPIGENQSVFLAPFNPEQAAQGTQ